MIQEDIKAKIKEAMLAKDQVRLEVYRGMSAAFTNELVAKGRKPQEMLNDEEALAVITRMSKQRKDSIDQYTKGGRQDLVDEEKAQLAIIETFLPQLMSREEIETVAKAKQTELGITDPSKKGMLMAGVMKDLKGKADGVLVKEVVDTLF
ncbi:MAG: GatB/YqeY domain-containing protein [Candidatus Pacebacteria bacterium]|nr:GatB/YqeY domain-containing protein [Candidatus Paceibacterota bacterium]